jgi:hypothetical protein
VFGDPTLADAILDHLTHRAHRIHLEAKESMREREAAKHAAKAKPAAQAWLVSQSVHLSGASGADAPNGVCDQILTEPNVTDPNRELLRRRLGGIACHVPAKQPVNIGGIRTSVERLIVGGLSAIDAKQLFPDLQWL